MYLPLQSPKRHNKVPSWLFHVIGSLLIGILFTIILSWYLNQPDVHYDVSTSEPVSCRAEGTDWCKEPIKHPVCQKALSGIHHKVWVAPEE